MSERNTRSEARSPLKTAFLILSILILMIGCDHSEEGPFGLYMGMKVSDIEFDFRTSELGNNPWMYTGKKVPDPVDGFTIYGLIVTQKQGLCRVTGAGWFVADELSSRYEDVESSLSLTYGKGTREINDDVSKTVWSKNLLGSPPRDAQELPHHVKKILLRTGPTRKGKAKIELDFTFTNIDECREEIKKIRNSPDFKW